MNSKEFLRSNKIILFLLFLVFASFVAILLLFVNKPEKNIDIGEVLKQHDFQYGCESFCNKYLIYDSRERKSLLAYCYTKMVGNDLNENGKIDTIFAATKRLEICEDAIYCFHIVPCETENVTIDWNDCRQVICQTLYDVYGNWDTANQKVKELFPSVGTCKLRSDKNWWEMYFGPNPCTNPPSNVTS